ncbi:hypothetical protein BH23CHL1_BH23CHL1_05970 [soil metagenome]
MATDPVESIRSTEHQTPFTANLRKRLVNLAHLEPSVEHPYLSVYVDWRPEGENPNVRPGKITLENKFSEHRRKLKDSDFDRRGFDADVERIDAFLEDGINPAVHGIFILSCDSKNVFETVLLAMPLDTRLTVSPTPDLRMLVRVIEDFPRFAVLHADQHDASVFIINRGSAESTRELDSNDYPSKSSAGGWSQRRFQARQEERVSHFAKAVAEETRKLLDETHIKMLVLSAGEVFGSALQEEFHQSVKERIVGEIHLDIQASESEIVHAALPVVEQAERNREADTIRTLEDALGAGNQGAGGVDDVLIALESGQVMTLLMAEDFEANGWADYGLNLYGAGEIPSEHPAAGDRDALVKIDLAEEFVRLALSTSATVEIVPSRESARLHKHGGVGAILRY